MFTTSTGCGPFTPLTGRLTGQRPANTHTLGRLVAMAALVAAAAIAALLAGPAPAAATSPSSASAHGAMGTAARTAVTSRSLSLSSAASAAVRKAMPSTRSPLPSPAALAGPGREQSCFGPDIRCTLQDAAGGVVGAVVPDINLPDPGDLIENPLEQVGEAIAKAAADAWSAAMLAIWNAGLFVLKVVLNFADSFLTPDLSGGGPGRSVYGYTLWIGGALVLIMSFIQLAVAAFRRDGKSLATMLIGTGQFVVVWSAWIGYCVIVVTACGGLTRALMKALLGVESWPEWEPWSDFSAAEVTDATVATVLGLLGMVLWIAAIGHLLVLLTRAAALIILAATGAISAAGLVADAGRSWFWKSLRWFHAAALTPVVMVLVLGIGVQLATGVASGLTDTTQQAIGTALPAVVLICISCVAPLALFKLLAFVDPGTPSGASVRAGLAGVGGVQGLLSGAGGGSGSNVASQTDSSGRSAGESGAEDDTSSRFTKSMTGSAAGVMSALGPVGAALGAGAGLVANMGAKGAAIGADETQQMGVGHNGYQPDFSGIRNNRDGQNGSGQPQRPAGEGTPGGDQNSPGGQGDPSDSGGQGGYPGGPDPSTLVPNPATVGRRRPAALAARQVPPRARRVVRAAQAGQAVVRAAPLPQAASLRSPSEPPSTAPERTGRRPTAQPDNPNPKPDGRRHARHQREGGLSDGHDVHRLLTRQDRLVLRPFRPPACRPGGRRHAGAVVGQGERLALGRDAAGAVAAGLRDHRGPGSRPIGHRLAGRLHRLRPRRAVGLDQLRLPRRLGRRRGSGGR